ncbi:MAG: peptidoglycan DD-metalloendopeptidase family protein, partial [Spirulinaceae cyanobacterium]
SLMEFVDAAKESGQPNAIANLSFDLTQIDIDGAETTRYEFTPSEIAALEYAQQNNVLVAVAAGNEGEVMSALGQASQQFDNVITVGSAEQISGETSVWQGFDKAEYASYGEGLDIVADDLGSIEGTSVATAKVTGAASQVWAANPELSYRQVIEILKSTATDINELGEDVETGVGLLNIAAAVSLARGTTPETKQSELPLIELPDLKTSNLETHQVDQDVVYLASSHGEIIRVNTRTSEETVIYQGKTFADIATTASDVILGTTGDSLYLVDPVTNKEKLIGEFPANVKIDSLTFSPEGTLYGADTNLGKLYFLSPQTAEMTEIPSLGNADLGNIVFNNHQILTTTNDQLVTVDTITGQSEVIGDLGFSSVSGLALLNGTLTAFTSEGQRLEINPQTGAAKIVGEMTSPSFINGVADYPSKSGIFLGQAPILPEPGKLFAPSISERPTNPKNPQSYVFRDSDKISLLSQVGKAALGQVSNQPPQNVTEAFNWLYNQRHQGQLGFPTGPVSRRQIAGQSVWLQEFTKWTKSGNRGIIVMRESDNNRTDHENVVYGVFGNPLKRWRIKDMGLPTGNSGLALTSPYGTEGWWQPFEEGTLHWTKPDNDSYALWQEYQTEYEAQGGSGGFLGFPTYEPNSLGRMQGRNWEIGHFEGGFMLWNAGLGAISFSWDDYQGANGVAWQLFWRAVAAGLSGDQIRALMDAYRPQSNAATQLVGTLRRRGGQDGWGWTQEFDGFDGKRILMLEDGKNEAFWVNGDNYREYMELGGPEGRWLDSRFVGLGFPRSNEQLINRPDGRYATWQAFSSGDGKSRIHHLGRSVATWGSIGATYTDIGGAVHWLGMPTRREYFDGEYTISDFEGGRIAFHRNTGWIQVLRPFFEEATSGSEWNTSVYSWNPAQSEPPGDLQNLVKLAVLNLGSHNRSDGKKGIQFDSGQGSPKGDSRLPQDHFALRSYTHAYFEEGKKYKAVVRGDDGFQLFAKHHSLPDNDPNKWVYFTPENEWQSAYGDHKVVEFTVPNSGWYDFHYHLYEGGGNAYFDLSWEEAFSPKEGHVNSNVGNIPLNFRDRPSLDSSTIIGKLPQGTTVKILEKVPGGIYQPGDRTDWYRIEANNKTGYVAAYYISEGSGDSGGGNSGWQNPLDPGTYTILPGGEFGARGGSHYGIDLSTWHSNPYVRVKAAQPGKVVEVGNHPNGWGNFIRIRHGNDFQTVYAHLSQIDVSEGQLVSGGQKIGNVGSTGNSSGPHLHFEIYVPPFRWPTDTRNPRNYLQF